MSQVPYRLRYAAPAFYNLIERRRSSEFSSKTACKCFAASILALIEDLSSSLIDENVNISNEFNVYRSVNYI